MRSRCYQITVCGVLGEIHREAFEGFEIEPNGTITIIVLTGDWTRRACTATLNRIQALGLEFVEVRRMAEPRNGLALSAGVVSTFCGS